jgi:hypothetical protein
MDIRRIVPSSTLAALLLALSSSVASANLITNGDFSAGNSGFNTGYALTKQTPQLFENNLHGIYAVIPIGNVFGQASYGDWNNVTKDPSGGNGNVFVADGSTNPNTTVWQQSVTVTPNTNYVFSYYAAEISNACCSNAVFVPTIGTSTGAGQTLTGAWAQYSFTWNSGSNTTASLSLTDTNLSGGYNDFVLDDLSFQAVTSAVPEPSTWAMIIIGFLCLGFMANRRQNLSARFA